MIRYSFCSCIRIITITRRYFIVLIVQLNKWIHMTWNVLVLLARISLDIIRTLCWHQELCTTSMLAIWESRRQFNNFAIASKKNPVSPTPSFYFFIACKNYFIMYYYLSEQQHVIFLEIRSDHPVSVFHFTHAVVSPSYILSFTVTYCGSCVKFSHLCSVFSAPIDLCCDLLYVITCTSSCLQSITISYNG